MVPGQLGVFAIDCWVCAGTGDAGEAVCSRCAGSGRAWFDRCPTSLYEPWVGRVLRAWREYRDGFLPVAGGMEDQTPHFRRAMAMLAAAAAAHERRARERAALERQRELERRRLTRGG